jgi:signal peptide peptidase SppA
MTDRAATLSEMPATFRARLDAALARPCMLDPGAVDTVRSAGGFRPRAEMGDGMPKRAPFVRQGDVAIVAIEGPLSQRALDCWIVSVDGYDAIEARVRAALGDAGVRAVVLRFDSPGGEVAGNAECARAIRAAADAAGKPLVSYVDEQCASAAYKLACATDEIVVPATGFAGSVGTIVVLADRVAANEAEGLNVRVVRSGKLKASPHPDEPLTDAAVARVQAMVDTLGRMFAEDVARARVLTVEGVLALEGAQFLGAEAVARGLADRIGNLNDAVARARGLAATTKRKRSMETVAKALGLPADASESDVLKSVRAMQADGETASKTIADLSRDIAAANERAGAAEKKLDEVERGGIIAAAKADRQWSPALSAFLERIPLADLRDWKASAPQVVPAGEINGPPAPPAADAQLPPSVAELAAKASEQGWKSLTADEKDAVLRHDRKLGDRLRKQSA